MDIAASIQKVTEEIMVNLANLFEKNMVLKTYV